MEGRGGIGGNICDFPADLFICIFGDNYGMFLLFHKHMLWVRI